MSKLILEPIVPTGLVATSSKPIALTDIPISDIREWIDRYRMVTLRGVQAPNDEEMRDFCQRLGTILEWDFGAVNELTVKENTKNYLYTNRGVPFHWDGAFVGKIPHYIFFHCRVAPQLGCGGETTFCDTIKLLQSISPDEVESWGKISVTYRTEKIVHYGGEFTSPLLMQHPTLHDMTLRFAEPVEDLNPVSLEVLGATAEQSASLLNRLNELLNSSDYCYAHEWNQDDIVIADNHALLHGRRPFKMATTRHLRRINIL